MISLLLINKLTNKSSYPKSISFEGLEENPSEIPSNINNISRNQDLPESVNEETNFEISNHENQEDIKQITQNIYEDENKNKSNIPKYISPKSSSKYEVPEIVEPASSKAVEEPLPSENAEDLLPSEGYEEPVSNPPEDPPEITSSIPDQN